MNRRRIISIAVGVVAAVLVGLCVTAYIFTARELKKTFVGHVPYPDSRYSAAWTYSHYEDTHPRTAISFESGKNTLRGWIYCPQNDRGLIVFAHGIGCTNETYINLLMKLTDCGWRVLAYDATGSGLSDGDGTVGLAQSALDLHNALLFVESDPELSRLPLFVLGHSWGGYASAAVLNFGHTVRAGVSLSGYSSPYAELREQCDALMGQPAGTLLHPFVWLYNKVTFGKYAGLSAVKGIDKSGIPVLVAHGDGDTMIAFDGASIIANKSRISNPQVRYHVFSDPRFNGHNSFFETAEYSAYKNAVLLPRQESLYAQYGKDSVPDSVREEFYASVDKEIYNGVNPELLSLIDGFFGENL